MINPVTQAFPVGTGLNGAVLNAVVPNVQIPAGQMPEDQEILSQFADIILPEPIGWWPLSTQVWIALIICSVLIIGAVVWLRHIQKKKAYKKRSNQRLSEIHENIDKLPVNTSYQRINETLKSCLLASGIPGKTLAPLHGKDWFSYLLSCVPENKRELLTSHQSSFTYWIKESYGAPTSKVNHLPEYIDFAQKIVAHHKPYVEAEGV